MRLPGAGPMAADLGPDYLDHMFGYILAVLIGLILLAFVIGGFAQLRPGPGRGRKGPGEQPLQSNNPAADEPTPDRSLTADPGEIRAAREHTPPA